MTKLLREHVSISELSELLIVEGRKHENYDIGELDKVFSLIAEVERYIHSKQIPTVLNQWYIGITDNVEDRKKAHSGKQPLHWEDWDCGSDKISRLTEIYFTKFRKTQGNPGGGTECRYLYCFLMGPLVNR